MKDKPLIRKLSRSTTEQRVHEDQDRHNYSNQLSERDASSLSLLPASTYQPPKPLTQPHHRPTSSIYSQPSVIVPPTFNNPWKSSASSDRREPESVRNGTGIADGGHHSRNGPALPKDSSGIHTRQKTIDGGRKYSTAISEYISTRLWTKDSPTTSLSPPQSSESSDGPMYLLWDNITGTIRRKSSIFPTGFVGRRGSSVDSGSNSYGRRPSSAWSTTPTALNTRSSGSISPVSSWRTISYADSDASRREESTYLSEGMYQNHHNGESRNRSNKHETEITMQEKRLDSLQSQYRPGPRSTINTMAPKTSTRLLLQSTVSSQQQHPRQHLAKSLFKPSFWRKEPIPPPTYKYKPPPARPGARLLASQTKVPTCSDQGKHLGIGTMRAVNPAEIDMLQGWMTVSMRKSGDTERAVKEIRKWLRHQNRAKVEWVGEWLHYRWDCEL